MKKYSANIRLPFPVNMEEKVRAGRTPTALMHFPFDAADLDPQFLALVKERGLGVGHTEVFYTPPFQHLAIHVDTAQLSNLVKLNWCYDAPGSRMQWWKLKGGASMTEHQTVVGTSYLLAAQRDCVMIESAEILQPTFVNAGVLHSVLNSTANGRWTLSVVLQLDGKDLQFDQAMQIFKDLLV